MPMRPHAPPPPAWLRDIEDCLGADGLDTVVESVKRALVHRLKEDGLDLPAGYTAPRADTYARRLLHRDPHGRFSVVVMTWGPGQGTPLHDHAGIWCVEAVVKGRMEVVQFDCRGRDGAFWIFEAASRTEAGVGSAGCLIPPFEYHVLRNLEPASTSVTVHVYGGDMEHCGCYEPAGAPGRYHRSERSLVFHPIPAGEAP